MAQAELPLAAQIVVLPPPCPSPPFLRSLRPRSPPLSFTFVVNGFTRRAWQGMSAPPNRGYDRRRRGRVSSVWDMHIE
eukprot:8007983-Pyramimonas_sp.AAC.1